MLTWDAWTFVDIWKIQFINCTVAALKVICLKKFDFLGKFFKYLRFVKNLYGVFCFQKNDYPFHSSFRWIQVYKCRYTHWSNLYNLNHADMECLNIRRYLKTSDFRPHFEIVKYSFITVKLLSKDAGGSAKCFKSIFYYTWCELFLMAIDVSVWVLIVMVLQFVPMNSTSAATVIREVYSGRIKLTYCTWTFGNFWPIRSKNYPFKEGKRTQYPF